MLNFSNPLVFSVFQMVLFLGITAIFLFYTYIYPKKSIHPVVLFIVISLFPIWSLFRYGTFQAGDLRTHTDHLWSFYQNLQDGIFFPRWSGNTCGGYGCPTFELEYILPYYIGSIFHFLGFSFLISIKLVLACAYVCSGITMYVWAKEEFSKKAAFVAAIFYLFAPYHLIDIHFRGSVGEVLSFVFVPIVFLYCKKLVETLKLQYFFLFALSILLLLLSHSSIAIVSVFLAAMYGISVWLKKKTRKITDLWFLAGSILYALCLSAFYWMPAWYEVKYTWQGFFTTFGIFPNPLFYFFSPNGFGMLYQGKKAEIYPLIGYTDLMMIGIGFYFFLKGKLSRNLKIFLACFLLLISILFFMLLPISRFVWEAIPLLHSFILIERMLIPFAFLTAALAGFVVQKINNKMFILVVCFLTIFLTVLNWANRKMVPPSKAPLTDESEFYTEYFEKNNPVYIKRFELRSALKYDIVTHPSSVPLVFLEGDGTFVQTKRTQEVHEYSLQAKSVVSVKDNTFYFPGWQVFANGKKIPINYTNNDQNSFGMITFSLPKGSYKIKVVLGDTSIRILSKLITFSALCFGFSLWLFTKFPFTNKKKIKEVVLSLKKRIKLV